MSTDINLREPELLDIKKLLLYRDGSETNGGYCTGL